MGSGSGLKMTLLFWLLLGVFVVTQGLSVKKVKDDDNVFKWPKTFKLKAKKMLLTGNIVEEIEIWKTPERSRIDYNNGYVKSFVMLKWKLYSVGVQYEIRPEASIDQDSSIVCHRKMGRWSDLEKLHNFLPEADEFEPVGKEVLNDKECTKFVYNSKDEHFDVRSSVWAKYDNETEVWIPVRHETLKFNFWLGLKVKHEIMDFYDFNTTFSHRSAFSLNNYNCGNVSTTATMDSKNVTKHLLFVDPDNDEHVDHVFNAFKNTSSRNYADANEHAMRRTIFQINMRKVVHHNRQNLGYKLSINEFADKTPEEMKRYMGLRRRPEGKVGTVPFPYDEDKMNDAIRDLPKEYDARLEGLVSNVKNQGTCGSCWTFGTTAAVEGALARVNGGTLMSLSNQALVDCAWGYGAKGCNGGTDNEAYEWMMAYGLPTEAEYGPYINRDGVCLINNMTKTYPIRGYTDVTPLSIEALKVALVNHGPLSVSVHVSDDFKFYSSGIFYDMKCHKKQLNHEVSLVGYGERDGDTFWILKNSWSPQWGSSGYMYISARDNVCGVTTEPTYVVF